MRQAGSHSRRLPGGRPGNGGQSLRSLIRRRGKQENRKNRRARQDKPKSVDPAVRQALRADFRAFLADPGLRKRIRRTAWLRYGFLVLGILLIYFAGRVSFYRILPFFGTKVPLIPYCLPERTRCLLFSLTSQRFEDEEKAQEFPYLDQADAIKQTPYSVFLRAEYLWRNARDEFVKPGPVLEPALQDTLANLYQSLDRGARLEPDNVLWPFMMAMVKAAEANAKGDASNPAMDCLSDLKDEGRYFAIPEPEAPYRLLLLEAEHYGSIDYHSLHLNADLVRRLAVLASVSAERGDSKPLQGIVEVTKALTRHAFDGTKSACRNSRMTCCFSQSVAWYVSLAMDRNPGQFSESTMSECKSRALVLNAMLDGQFMPDLLSADLLIPSLIVPRIADFLWVGCAVVLLFSLGQICCMVLVRRWQRMKLHSLLFDVSFPFTRLGKLHKRAKNVDGPWQWKIIRRPVWDCIIGFGSHYFWSLFIIVFSFTISGFQMKTVKPLLFSPRTAFEQHQQKVWASYDARFTDLGRALVEATDPAEVEAAAKAAGLTLPEEIDDNAKKHFEKACQAEKAYQVRERENSSSLKKGGGSDYSSSLDGQAMTSPPISSK